MGFCSLTGYTHVRAGGPAWDRATLLARGDVTEVTELARVESCSCVWDIIAVGTLLLYAGARRCGCNWDLNKAWIAYLWSSCAQRPVFKPLPTSGIPWTINVLTPFVVKQIEKADGDFFF